MEPVNPYEAPKANLDDRPGAAAGEYELATLGQRFGGAIIDAIIGIVVAIPIWLYSGFWNYITSGEEPPYSITIMFVVGGFALFLAIHGYFLKRDGQTLGKKVAGTKIVDLNDRLPDFWRMIALRYLPLSLLNLVPFAPL